MVRSVSMVWLLLLAMLASATARAAGTPAGTSIPSTAQVTYTLGGSSQSTSSNTVTVIVAEILDVVVTVGSTKTVSPGAAQQALLFTVTNTGNGNEAFPLTALSAGVTGDDFDPQLASTAIYFDSDNSNDFSAADIAYVPGSNDPALAPDANVRVLVLNNIPAVVADGAHGRTQLTATARTGSGTAGTVFAGQGDGGLDAVTGTSGASRTQFGEYIVAGLQLSAVKTQTIVDSFGGTRAVPGARINYQVIVAVAGSGTAPAAVFSDSIPANTSYVAGSLQLNGASLSDLADADVGELVSTPAPQVRIQLGDLTQAAGPQTISFAVTIN
ncbi:MAG: hypothetical protein ACJ8MH_00655 [Povalibacter sp.]